MVILIDTGLNLSLGLGNLTAKGAYVLATPPEGALFRNHVKGNELASLASYISQTVILLCREYWG